MAKITQHEESSDPSVPASGNWHVYFKSGGLYIEDSSGNVSGPLIPDAPSDGSTYGRNNAAWTVAGGGGLPTGHLFGLTLSNGTDATNDINIAVGKCRNLADDGDMVLASVLTKQLDAAWSVGTNQGGLDTGSIADTTYHVWLIKRTDTGVVDALFSASASAPTMPANYDQKRRIGSIVRASAALKAFVQDGDLFTWKVPVADVNASNPGTSAVTRTLTVPLGIRVEAIIFVAGYGATAAGDNPKAIFISDLSITDTAASIAADSIQAWANTMIQNGSTIRIMTNTSGQVRSRLEVSTANTSFFMNTNGWIDTRGRLS